MRVIVRRKPGFRWMRFTVYIEPIGYDVLVTSSRQGEGTSALKNRLKSQLAVFAGQSGVGKSSLLNALVPGLTLETNEISNRLGRGKHTTRHVELINIGGRLCSRYAGI